MDHQPSSIHLSPGQLQNELESIRSLRRISLSQPSSDLDPDLPSSLQIDSSSNPSSSIIIPHSLSSSLTSSDQISIPNSTPTLEQPDPGLFWLPARLHPEIAPQEFKAFIEEATKPENLLRRTSSALGSRRNNSSHASDTTRVMRKKSMLSNVYHPSEHDLSSLPPKPSADSHFLRGSSMTSPNHRDRGTQGLDTLTINDLQNIEALVLKRPYQNFSSEPMSDSDLQTLNLYDHRIKSIISRSLSLGGNSTTSSDDSQTNLDPADSEAIDDSPLISRAPGHIIRRTARTKVRKPLLPGDGNGHRFPATRRAPVKNSLLTTSPGKVSIASSLSEETLNGDPPSNRNSNEDIQKSTRHIPSRSVSSEDPLAAGLVSANEKLAISTKPHVQRPNLNPLSGSRPSQTCLLDASPHPYPPSSEDDQSVSSASRPDSVISNSSLLDAYNYEDISSDDPAASINFGNFDLNESSISPPKIKLAAQSPLKSDEPSSADHPPLENDSDSAQTPTPHSIALPPVKNQLSLSHPASSKPDGLKVITNNLTGPILANTSLRPDDLLSNSNKLAASESTVTLASAVNSNSSSGTLSSSSPQNPLSTHPSRPAVTRVNTSPNLTTVASTVNPILPGPSSAGPKEVKEKKRAWVKLGLASAVSPSSKSKKEKGKDKQKIKADSQQTNDGPLGQSSHPAASQSGGSSNTPAVVIKKESGFLSGLFGGKSKKQDSEQEKQNPSPSQSAGNTKSSQNHHNNGGSNLPGQMQVQQQLINPTASGGFIKGRFMSFYRLPIHVERAVYRLSHIKLANPRRPLYEQVLISNLMFWYLGVINKTPPAQPVNHNQPPPSNNTPASPSPGVPSSSNHKQKSGNSPPEKNKTSHQSSTKSQKRAPGIKKNWKKNQVKDAPSSSSATASGSMGSSSTTVNQGWIEPDSSESSESETEEQQGVEGSVRRPKKGNQEKPPSSSSSSSSSSSTISSDDDEKPLGSRIGLSQQIQINKIPSSSTTNANSQSMNDSKINNNNSSKPYSGNNHTNSRNNHHHNTSNSVQPDRNLDNYYSRSNTALVQPKS